MKKLTQHERDLLKAFLSGYGLHEALGDIGYTGLALYFSDYLDGYNNAPFEEMAELVEALINPVVEYRAERLLEEAAAQPSH